MYDRYLSAHSGGGSLLDRHYLIVPFDERYEQDASRKQLAFSSFYSSSKQTASPWVFEP